MGAYPFTTFTISLVVSVLMSGASDLQMPEGNLAW